MKYWVTTLATASMVLGLTAMVSAQAAPAQPAPAQAQSPAAPGPPAPVTTTAPTWEFSLGYQYLFTVASDNLESDQFPYGLAIDAARNWGPFGIVGEAGWSFRTEGHSPDKVSFNLIHFAGGVRWSLRKSRSFWPYAQVLVGGAAHSFDGEALGVDIGDTTGHMILQPGGGFTWVAGDGWGIVGAVDYRRLFFNQNTDFDQGVNHVRVFGGVRMILD